MTGRRGPRPRRALVAASLFIAVLGIPMIFDLVAPNGVYGYRTSASLASEAAWYRANRASGTALLAGGLVAAAVNWRLGRSSLSPRQQTLIGAGMLVVAALLSVLAGALAI